MAFLLLAPLRDLLRRALAMYAVAAAAAGVMRLCESSELIENHNTANDGSTYKLGHNAFSHLSWEEFKETVRLLPFHIRQKIVVNFLLW